MEDAGSLEPSPDQWLDLEAAAENQAVGAKENSLPHTHEAATAQRAFALVADFGPACLSRVQVHSPPISGDLDLQRHRRASGLAALGSRRDC